MYPGYWEDYMNDGTPGPDQIRNVYRITLNGTPYDSLTGAAKATGLIGRWALESANSALKIDLLKKAGATITVRKYNETQKRWETGAFDTV